MSASLYHLHIAESGYRPQHYAYYYKQWQQYEMDYHQHQSTEIMYMISGCCRIELYPSSGTPKQAKNDNAVKGVGVDLQKGQFIVIDANIPHRLIVGDTPCRMLNLEFGLQSCTPTASILHQLIQQEKELAELIHTSQPYMVLSDPEDVYYTLKSLVLELDQQREGSMLGDLLFAQLLVRIARLSQEHRQQQTPLSERYVHQSIQFMRQNYDRSIRMEQIAASVNVHPSYLHRIFKKHMHSTPTDYLNTLRMDKAMMLLGQTDIPIAEIADYVGVASRPYFHLLFKKHTGYTPADYRMQSERFVRSYQEPANEGTDNQPLQE
ncbi:helix-turn-helix domain-containing protein [Paenibacillus sp. WLX1005]|uniref:AraC family transcriptional regulator n=1 Tax=Paenibacillus sp. WLX1005 TaxID=3243766 RepID=UPI0039841872